MAEVATYPQSGTALDPALAFSVVSKSFAQQGGGRLEVLRDVSFIVPAGGIVAILGPSGCGKTTLLNIAAGLAAPDRGAATLPGALRQGAIDWHRVGYMFQDDRLLPWRNAQTNVELSLETGAMQGAERRRRAAAALALVGLADFARAYPQELSGGMRSRVALARSLVQEPVILLMDEPFSRLDAQTRGAMHRELLRIHALRRLAILFVTHDVEEAVALADHVVVLAHRPGRVRSVAAVPFDHPRAADPAAAALAGELRTLISEDDQQTAYPSANAIRKDAS